MVVVHVSSSTDKEREGGRGAQGGPSPRIDDLAFAFAYIRGWVSGA